MFVIKSEHIPFVTLVLHGRFDFASHNDFYYAYEPYLTNVYVTQLTIDLQHVDYMDSSALGMLLLLRDKAVATKADIVLNLHSNVTVSNILAIANFQKLFKIID